MPEPSPAPVGHLRKSAGAYATGASIPSGRPWTLERLRSKMIDLYTWTTPNGRKVSIVLEELGLPYRVHPINIGNGEQFAPDYVAINPNSKIPSIVDPEGPDGAPIEMMESGAILIYLADKTGALLPKAARGRCVALQWLMFQMGGV